MPVAVKVAVKHNRPAGIANAGRPVFQAIATKMPIAPDGLEPSLPCGKGILSPSCLPIPPRGRAKRGHSIPSPAHAHRAD